MPRSPRFHGISAPSGSASASSAMNGVNARSKNGAPTEILSPVSASRTIGAMVPANTTPQPAISSRLFRISPPSRLIGENTPSDLSAGARQA